MNNDKIVNNCLKEMFKRVGENYEKSYLLLTQEDWYRSKTWTQEEEDDFKDWMTVYLQKHKKDWTSLTIEREIAWFLLMWGWSIKEK